MKTVILFGSPRKDGNTRAMTDAFGAAIKTQQTDVRLLYLNDMNIRPCQSCFVCYEKGVCRINDDMRDIYKYVMESDLVVYATPVYWFAPSAQLKLVMDRSVAFLDKELNSRVKGKKAVTLMSCADTDAAACGPALDIFRRTFELLGMEYAGHVEAVGCETKGKVPAEALDAVRGLAASLFMSPAAGSVSHFLSKKIGKAIWDYRMLKDGDKVLLAVSGGKDSLTLLRVMKERLRFVPIEYELIACHVDMGFDWVDTDLLRRHFEDEGVRYVIAKPNESWKPKEEFGCFWCSWSRRKVFFSLMAEMGCSKLALGHHTDDIVETMLMNLLFNGEIGTMKPYQEMFEGEFAIIRPLAYVEEKELKRVAERLELPVIKSQCPNGDTSKRKLVKGIITEMEKHNRNVKKNIFRSLQRVREEYLLSTPTT